MCSVCIIEKVDFVASGGRTCKVKVHIDFGVSRYFISDIRLNASWDEGAPNITFSTASGVPTTSRAVGTLKFLASDVHVSTRLVVLERAEYVPNRPHSLISVSQLTEQCACAWGSPDFVHCTWKDSSGVAFEFSYANREHFWKVDPIPETGVDTVYGLVNALAVTRSSAGIDSTAVLRPTGHPRRGQPKPAAMSPDINVHNTPSAAANFIIKVGLLAGELTKLEQQPHDGWQLIESEV